MQSGDVVDGLTPIYARYDGALEKIREEYGVVIGGKGGGASEIRFNDGHIVTKIEIVRASYYGAVEIVRIRLHSNIQFTDKGELATTAEVMTEYAGSGLRSSNPKTEFLKTSIGEYISGVTGRTSSRSYVSSLSVESLAFEFVDKSMRKLLAKSLLEAESPTRGMVTQKKLTRVFEYPNHKIPTHVEKIIRPIISRAGGYKVVGGEATKYGISEKILSRWKRQGVSADQVENLTVNQASDYYYEKYYVLPGYDEFPESLLPFVMDVAVVLGTRSAMTLLSQQCCKTTSRSESPSDEMIAYFNNADKRGIDVLSPLVARAFELYLSSGAQEGVSQSQYGPWFERMLAYADSNKRKEMYSVYYNAETAQKRMERAKASGYELADQFSDNSSSPAQQSAK